MVKQSLAFYTVDTDRYQDRRIKRLKKSCGCEGLAVYDYILCEIYRVRGCFLEWDDNTCFDVAEYLSLTENDVQEIVRFCASVGLFDEGLLNKGVITSASIQRRYKEMCSRARRRNVVIPELIRLEQNTDEVVKSELIQIMEEAPEENTAAYNLSLEEEIAELKKDHEWLEEEKKMHGIDMNMLKKSLDDFKVQCVADGKGVHNSIMDAKSHFNSWLRIMVKKEKQNDRNTTNTRAKRRGTVLTVSEKKNYNSTF